MPTHTETFDLGPRPADAAVAAGVSGKEIFEVQLGGNIVRIEMDAGTPPKKLEEIARDQIRLTHETKKREAAEAEARAAEVEAERDVGESPFLPAGVRPFIRREVEKLPQAAQIALDVGPGIAGGLVALPSAVTPAGPLIISGVGTSFDIIAQEIGLKKRNGTDILLNLFGGPAASGIARVPKTIAKITKRVPGFRKAIAVRTKQIITERAKRMAGALGGKAAAPLWQALKEGGFEVKREALGRAAKVLNTIRAEALEKASAFPDGQDIANLATSIIDEIISATKTLPRAGSAVNPLTGATRAAHGKVVSRGPLDMDTLRTNIQSLGRQIGRLEGKGGIQEGSRKRLFKAFWDDLEAIQFVGKTGRGVRIFKAAREASKREFAVDTFTQVIESAITPIKGEGAATAFNAAGVLRKLRALVNPDNPLYDKNFHSALGNNPQFHSALKLLEMANDFPASGLGAGSLMFASKLAAGGAFVADSLGFSPALGAVVALQLPEVLTEFLLNPKRQKTLARLIRSGNGVINDRALRAATLGVYGVTKTDDPDIAGEIIKGIRGIVERIPTARTRFRGLTP